MKYLYPLCVRSEFESFVGGHSSRGDGNLAVVALACPRQFIWSAPRNDPDRLRKSNLNYKSPGVLHEEQEGAAHMDLNLP